jgi:crotonobetainyl-CoA:carnitine CoA-transferase CaiB-like acyl-CoA transferase
LTSALLDADGTSDAMADTAERTRGGAEVMRRVRAKIAAMPTAEVLERLSAADVPVAPVLAPDEVAHHEQVVACGTVQAFEHGVLGPVHQPRPAPRFDGEQIDTARTAPRHGEHADEVLTEAGWDQAEIDELRAAGVVA